MDNLWKQPLVAAALGRQQLEFRSSHIPTTPVTARNGDKRKK